MTTAPDWQAFGDALAFAVSRVEGDRDPLNDREAADGHQYVLRTLTAVTQSAVLTFDPDHPEFLPMQESVRFLGAAGPDIDYDVAMIRPGVRYRVSGERGGGSYVGVAVYGFDGERGATKIVASVDVDELVGADGRFVYEFEHPQAARVIVRQYFHDRASQRRGSWSIVPTTATDVPRASTLPVPAGVAARVTAASHSLRWNAQLNQLWTPDRRDRPNEFVRQTADDIVAAVPNPDVVYAFSWWRLAEGERLEIELTPPETRYWGLQLCDRWFQCFPERRTNINDHQARRDADGRVRIVISDGDPGAPNWLDTSGHRTGTLFFRWLHADPTELPVCRVVPG